MRTEEIDSSVLGELPWREVDAVSVLDLCRRGGRIGTYKNSLKRLVNTGCAARRWDGNERYGRYLYWRKVAAGVAAD